MKCGHCKEDIDSCDDCYFIFEEGEDIFCYPDGRHICRDCEPKATKAKVTE